MELSTFNDTKLTPKQGAWLDKHFPHGVKAEDRRVPTDGTLQSMKELGINQHQSSQSRLIANEPHPTPNKRPKQNPPPAMKPSPAIVYNRTTPENKPKAFISHFKAI